MKLKNILAMAAGAAASMTPAILMAQPPTPDPMQSQVQAHLRLNIKDDVKEVHFISTNNDPTVYSKVYILKNADPYEIRPYLITAVGGNYGTDNNCGGSQTAGDYSSQTVQPTVTTLAKYASSTGMALPIPSATTYGGNLASGYQSAAQYQGRRVDSSMTKVECIKFMDGVGAVVISAEDYRFTKEGNENAMTIDEIISILDQPKITSSSGQKMYMYFPRYWAADALAVPLQRSGMNGSSAAGMPCDPYQTQWELQEGKDRVRVDSYLNALVFYVPAYSIKNINKMLEQYDKPNPEASINYTVYDLDTEIDSQVGDDFQAWKNGPGQDLFSVAGRFTNGWDISNMNVARNNADSSNSAKYINFNPKWNTRYLDLLAAKSYAKVVTSGSISIMTNRTGSVKSLVEYPIMIDGSNPASAATNSGITEVAITNVAAGAALVGLQARNGVNATTVSAAATLYRYKYASYNGNGALDTANPGYFYEMQVNSGNVMAGTTSLGHDVILLPNGTAITVNGAAPVFVTSSNYEPTALAIQHAPTQVSSIASLGTGNTGYGFSLTLGGTPALTISEKATIVPVQMTNTNLIGFTSDGAPRTSLSTVNTVLQVNTKGEKFVIGGLDKVETIRSTSKLPYLGDIPGLGWALGTERESQKRSQLVAVLEITPVLPDTAVPAAYMSQIADDKAHIENYGVKNSVFDENDYGYDQFLLDSDKKSFDPLP